MPIFRSWRLSGVFAACGIVPWLCRHSDPVGWLCVHWGVRSTTELWPPTQPRHYTTRGKNTTKSSAPEDWHKVARNMLSNLKRRNKYNTKWYLVDFLFHIKIIIVASSWLFILLYQWCTVTQTSNHGTSQNSIIKVGDEKRYEPQALWFINFEFLLHVVLIP